jgi:hypothetical protein
VAGMVHRIQSCPPRHGGCGLLEKVAGVMAFPIKAFISLFPWFSAAVAALFAFAAVGVCAVVGWLV